MRAMTTATGSARALASDVDPVRFEVIRNALLAITEEMGATLRRAVGAERDAAAAVAHDG